MQPDPEARVRAAVEELVGAVIDLARSSQPTPAAGPVELLSPAAFARRASLSRSSTYLALASGAVRSVKVRGRRLIPISELTRLAAEAGPVNTKKAAPAIVSPGAARGGTTDAAGRPRPAA